MYTFIAGSVPYKLGTLLLINSAYIPSLLSTHVWFSVCLSKYEVLSTATPWNHEVICNCRDHTVIYQLPQLPLTSWQFRKVPLVSESLGPHPLHWGIQQSTGFIILATSMPVRMLVMAPQATYYIFKMVSATPYPLWLFQNISSVIL